MKHFSLLSCVVCIFLLCGCGSKKHATEIYQAHTDSTKSTKSIASVLMLVPVDISDYVDYVIINNIRIDHKKYGEIRIVPGSYKIEWGRKFNISPMLKASGTEKRVWNTNITLEAGHIYTVHAKRTVGHGYKIYSWITDDTLNEVIWGNKYLPGPYDHLRSLQ